MSNLADLIQLSHTWRITQPVSQVRGWLGCCPGKGNKEGTCLNAIGTVEGNSWFFQQGPLHGNAALQAARDPVRTESLVVENDAGKEIGSRQYFRLPDYSKQWHNDHAKLIDPATPFFTRSTLRRASGEFNLAYNPVST